MLMSLENKINGQLLWRLTFFFPRGELKAFWQASPLIEGLVTKCDFYYFATFVHTLSSVRNEKSKALC